MKCTQGTKTTDKCLKMAKQHKNTDQNKSDLELFRVCIAKHYCFLMSGSLSWRAAPVIPRVLSSRQDKLFHALGRRVQRFFLRNNNWKSLIKTPPFKPMGTGKCRTLLYVTAARFLYVMYVFHILTRDFPFYKCKVKSGTERGVEHGACFSWPGEMTCASKLEFKLLGSRSGTVTSLFYQYFRQGPGKDKTVPGFGSTSEQIMGVRISAYKLDYALPYRFPKEKREYSDYLTYMLEQRRKGSTIQLLGVAVATYKMRRHNVGYYNELISATAMMRHVKPLHHIAKAWAVEIMQFEDNIKRFQSSAQYSTGVNFKRRHNINYELVLGNLESAGIAGAKILTEDALVLLENADAYITPGTIRHVIGDLQMKLYDDPGKRWGRIYIEDYWMSMLENWADAYRVHREQCTPKQLFVGQCLVKMSPYLKRMVNAMSKVVGKVVNTKTESDNRLVSIKNVEKILNYFEYLRTMDDERVITHKSFAPKLEGWFFGPPYFADNTTLISNDDNNTETFEEDFQTTAGKKRTLYTSTRRATTRRRRYYSRRRRYYGRRRRYYGRRRRYYGRRRRSYGRRRRYYSRRRRALGKMKQKVTNLIRKLERKLLRRLRKRRRKWKTWNAKIKVGLLKKKQKTPQVPHISNPVGKFIAFFNCIPPRHRRLHVSKMTDECMYQIQEVVNKFNIKLYMHKAQQTIAVKPIVKP